MVLLVPGNNQLEHNHRAGQTSFQQQKAAEPVALEQPRSSYASHSLIRTLSHKKRKSNQNNLAQVVTLRLATSVNQSEIEG
jgi:hypothetical protein